jgi:hypothetical protein
VHWNDLTYAIRALRRSPRFTIAAALTLALGIGANAAIFSIFNAVYLRPLPFPDSDTLVMLQDRDPRTGAPAAVKPEDFLRWRGASLFSGAGAWAWTVVTLGGGSWPERVQVQQISSTYLPTLGVQPAIGRNFLPEEEKEGDCVLLLSDRLWRNWLGAGTERSN